MGYLNFFGSKDQDKWVIQDIFNFKKRDIFRFGSYKWLMENNTYVLESYFDWDGIAIEANERFFQN